MIVQAIYKFFLFHLLTLLIHFSYHSLVATMNLFFVSMRLFFFFGWGGGVCVCVCVLNRFPGEGNGNPLQYYCLGNFMERGAWWATVHEVATVGHDWATKPLYIYIYMHACMNVWEITSSSFSVWLTSLSIMPLRSIHVVVNGKISFFFFGWVILHCTIYYLSVHPLMDSLGCFHVAGIVSNAVINMGMQISLWESDFISFR